ncbi:MAG: capsule assembly Wzi family protein [Ignavibacteria bacterium]
MKRILIIIIVLISTAVYGQVEIVPAYDKVYDYLKRMQLKGVIDYNSSILPLSREKVASFLREVSEKLEVRSEKLEFRDETKNSDGVTSDKVMKNRNKKIELSKVEREMLRDFMKEYEYELTGRTKESVGFLNEPRGRFFIEDRKKYFYKYDDSVGAVFVNLQGFLSQGVSSGDSLGKNAVTLGNLGFQVRGTVLNTVGFSLKASNGQKIAGDKKSLDFVTETLPKFRSFPKFKGESNNFDYFEGYLRYRLGKDNFAVTLGRDYVNYGFGYMDKLFLSGNSVPFSFIKFDLNFGAFTYNFIYGSLKGDSLAIKDIAMKNIITHRLSVNFSKYFKAGFYEALITADRPFNFTYLNPFSFIRSADYNAGTEQSGLNNALMGFDVEVTPVKNFALQGSLLIDDLNFSTIFSNERDNGKPANDNRFAWQVGAVWTDAFTLPNLNFTTEYTRLNPFVYTHRTNKSQYTNWTLPLGHNLPPNSDEVALKLSYDVTSRLNVNVMYQHQRSGTGFEFSGDSLVRNYGGYIHRGDADVSYDDKFLQGKRVDRDLVTVGLRWMPVYQYVVDFRWVMRNVNNLFEGRRVIDNWLYLTVGVEL